MIGLSILDTVIALLLAATTYQSDRLPYRAAWGSYVVAVEKTDPADTFSTMRLRVLDASGHMLREIHYQTIVNVTFPELTGKAPPELAVDAYTGGTHCCLTQYYFTQEGGLRNLLSFAAINGDIWGFKDLNRDGRPELLAASDSLAYFGGLPYSHTAWIRMVIGWDGHQYVDQTRRYPAPTRSLARENQRGFLTALKKRGEEGERQRRMMAAGYYGNSLVIGQGARARSWLLRRAPRATRRWLLENEADLKALVAGDHERIHVSQERLLEQPGLTEPTAHAGDRRPQ
jgi:hypothetical protein